VDHLDARRALEQLGRQEGRVADAQEPKLSLPGLALAWATSSLTLAAGNWARTSSTKGVVPGQAR